MMSSPMRSPSTVDYSPTKSFSALPSRVHSTSATHTPRSTGISVRLWKVTGSTSSFDDGESKEALSLVSEKYASRPSGISTKAKNRPSKQSQRSKATANGSATVNSDTDSDLSELLSDSDQEPQEPHTPWLSNSSSAGGHPRRSLLDRKPVADLEAATKARTYLKRDIEGKMVDTSVKFLEAFRKVDDKLQILRAHLLEMQSRCTDIQTQLDQTDQGTKNLLEKADGLREQKASTYLRAQLSTLFLARFTLTVSESAVLTSREIEVGPDLFAAMDKVAQIRKDCRSLFEFVGEGAEGGAAVDGEGVEGRDPALAAKDIMAATSEQLEIAYDKIFRWCQFEFRKYTRDASLEVSNTMREAVKRLMGRDQMLEDALQILNDVRQSSVLHSFLDALTKGGPGGMPRPIELHAHDPTRYVGDMLAWIHQVTASEREFLDALFDIQTHQKRRVGEARDLSSESREEILGRQCLDKHLEGLGRPLKVRVLQTIQSQEDIIVGYKIANLVQFYLVTMQRTIGSDAALTKSLEELHGIALKAFSTSLEAQGRSLLRFLHPPDANLAAPVALRDSAHVLQEVMSVYDTSLIDDKDKETDFATVLDAAIDPAMEMCKRMVEMLPKATDWEKNTFMINCALYLSHVMSPYSFAAKRLDALSLQVDEWRKSMITQHYDRLASQSGLRPLIDALEAKDSNTPLSLSPESDPKSLHRAMKTFDDFLISLDVLTSSRLALISSPKLAADIHHRALRRLAKDYASLYAAVHDKANKYEFPSTIMGRVPDEVSTLFGTAS